ncbi:MAG: PAS domain S-box protein [Thermodesulfobacteriota bacterium]
MKNGRKKRPKALPGQAAAPHCSAAETSADAVITSDSADRILTWNQGAERIFGYGEEIIGKPATTLIPERYRRDHLEGMRRFLETGEEHILGKTVELRALRKDGTEFPIELTLSSWKSPEGMQFGAIIRDISERKRAEGLREQVHRMLRHDLRSPLVGILGLARVLQEAGSLTDRQRKAAGLIQDLGLRMLRTMDRSRDLFRMEEGTYPLTPGPVNLVQVLSRVRAEVGPLISGKELVLQISLQGRPAEEVQEYRLEGEEALLETMLANLLVNAAEASPRRAAIRVTVARVNEKGRWVHVIDIHNEGVIPEEIRERFLEPYATSGKKGGSGLGAHSALLVARTHHGTIEYTTSETEGTHVVVRLPCEPRRMEKGVTTS